MDFRKTSDKSIQDLAVDCEQYGVNVFGSKLYEMIVDPTCLSHLGSGTYGTCYTVQISRNYWVVKLIPDVASSIQSMQREIRALSALHGVPGLQKMIGVCPWKLVLITEYAGDSLDNYLETQSCTFSERLQIIQQVACTLLEVNARGWVHNDVKIHNICVQKTDNGIQATLIDFGLAVKVGDSIPFAPGTEAPFQTAPEVLKSHRITPQADVYSVGRLVQCLLSKHLSYLDRELRRWLIRSFNNDPNQRGSLEELLEYLGGEYIPSRV
ncbi:probable myosin light chain kinase DDB_G0292624 [Homarus americanus]|uniref:probable myosin light chain kinase DDB_G0292624 n=1 Tax=Homarus americanus TaxID=6706 RepID=UPI001C470B14|nr:probable myosin light chain kinase DDB_G0292624 [Homarus americanus]